MNSAHRQQPADRPARTTPPGVRGAPPRAWRACPKVNSPDNVPTVEGAYTPSNKIFVPPLRITSMSSMQSAPRTMPATGSASFGNGFADSDLIRGALIRPSRRTTCSTRSARPTPSPARRATRDGHRRTPRRTHMTLAPEVPSRTGPDCCPRTPIIPAQRALFSFDTQITPGQSVGRG